MEILTSWSREALENSKQVGVNVNIYIKIL